MLPTLSVFNDIWVWLNNLVAKLNFDKLFIDFYQDFIQNVPKLFKWLYY